MAWVSPTGFVDAASHWDRAGTPALCYDENTGTGVDPDAVAAPGDWCPFVEFTRPAIECNAVRYFPLFFTEIDVDVFYDAAWEHCFQGAVAEEAWNEKPIPAGRKTVTKMRIRGRYTVNVWGRHLREVDFYEVEPCIGAISQQHNPFGISTITAGGKIHG